MNGTLWYIGFVVRVTLLDSAGSISLVYVSVRVRSLGHFFGLGLLVTSLG